MGYPVTEEAASVMGLPVDVLAEARTVAAVGNAMHVANMGCILLSALSCVEDVWVVGHARPSAAVRLRPSAATRLLPADMDSEAVANLAELNDEKRGESLWQQLALPCPPHLLSVSCLTQR